MRFSKSFYRLVFPIALIANIFVGSQSSANAQSNNHKDNQLIITYAVADPRTSDGRSENIFDQHKEVLNALKAKTNIQFKFNSNSNGSVYKNFTRGLRASGLNENLYHLKRLSDDIAHKSSSQKRLNALARLAKSDFSYGFSRTLLLNLPEGADLALASKKLLSSSGSAGRFHIESVRLNHIFAFEESVVTTSELEEKILDLIYSGSENITLIETPSSFSKSPAHKAALDLGVTFIKEAKTSAYTASRCTRIVGVVKDTTGATIYGAHVSANIPEFSGSAQTDDNGNYLLKVCTVATSFNISICGGSYLTSRHAGAGAGSCASQQWKYAPSQKLIVNRGQEQRVDFRLISGPPRPTPTAMPTRARTATPIPGQQATPNTNAIKYGVLVANKVGNYYYGLEGVEVKFTVSNVGSRTVFTDSFGFARSTAPLNSRYTITLSKPGSIFNRASIIGTLTSENYHLVSYVKQTPTPTPTSIRIIRTR